MIPRELTKRPFSLEEARRAGLTLSSLRGHAWRRLGAELYCYRGLRQEPWHLLSAWSRMLPRETVFAGATAAWLWGLDLVPNDPVEVIVPTSSGIRSHAGLRARRCHIEPGEVVSVKSLRTTSINRTLLDLCTWAPIGDALVAMDRAVRLGLANAAALGRHPNAIRGRAGSRRLRTLALIAAAAESPMETRLRWLLIQAGLPPPQVQTKLCDHEQRFVGRADLYYPAGRLVIEYDGGNHRERLVEDNRRQNLLINAGYQLLRFTAPDIYDRPEVVIAQVRFALDVKGA